MASSSSKHVIVLGAGVIGLTTAIKIIESGDYRVTIIAELFPTDPKSIKYTSHWAGAHHVSLAGKDERQQKMDKETFDTMWAMSAPGAPTEGCFLRIPQSEYYHPNSPNPHALQHMPDYAPIAPQDLFGDSVGGITFTTISIDTPIYLNYLLSRFLSRGGTIIRGTVQHIAQLAEGGTAPFENRTHHPLNSGGNATGASPPTAIVVCVGLGARSLGGVEDKSVYPLRGQTLLIRAPWVRFGKTVEVKDGIWTYIIPRRSGDVIVGGTRVANDWYPSPRPSISHDILVRAFALCPELAPPSIRTSDRSPTIDDVKPLIVEEGCGFRPAREGGIRLEVEWVQVDHSGTFITSSGSGQSFSKDQHKVPVVYNYGHAGYGFQSSWGSASIALELLNEALAKGE